MARPRLEHSHKCFNSICSKSVATLRAWDYGTWSELLLLLFFVSNEYTKVCYCLTASRHTIVINFSLFFPHLIWWSERNSNPVLIECEAVSLFCFVFAFHRSIVQCEKRENREHKFALWIAVTTLTAPLRLRKRLLHATKLLNIWCVTGIAVN